MFVGRRKGSCLFISRWKDVRKRTDFEEWKKGRRREGILHKEKHIKGNADVYRLCVWAKSTVSLVALGNSTGWLELRDDITCFETQQRSHPSLFVQVIGRCRCCFHFLQLRKRHDCRCVNHAPSAKDHLLLVQGIQNELLPLLFRSRCGNTQLKRIGHANPGELLQFGWNRRGVVAFDRRSVRTSDIDTTPRIEEKRDVKPESVVGADKNRPRSER